ncbi:MAG: NlpC/P60 family protein [Firmicutes bacterium]|nr:NlpC/P60 family protein [Bacillota bacterium]
MSRYIFTLLLAAVLLIPTTSQAGTGFLEWQQLILAEPLDSELLSDPQGFAVEAGNLYILDTVAGKVVQFNHGKPVSEVPVPTQSGHLVVDGPELLVLENMLPLDEPRRLHSYRWNQHMFSRELPVNEEETVAVNPPSGAEIAITPQLKSLIPVNDSFLLQYSTGKRWLWDPVTNGFTPYPQPLIKSETGHMEFVAANRKHVLETTGTAVAFSYLGLDGQGRQYYTFTDYIDPLNQRQIIIRAGRETKYADVTQFADPTLNTWACVDPKDNTVYTANRDTDTYQVYKIGERNFKSIYDGFAPQPVPWYYQQSIAPGIANAIVREQEALWDKHGRANRYNQLTRQDAWETGLAYVDYIWTPGPENYTGPDNTTVIRTLPTWLPEHPPGEPVRGLPYCWGGCMTLEDFDRRLDLGWQAGNVEPVGPYHWGTIGVDCSGLVWNVYGYESRPDRGYAQTSNPRYFTRIPHDQLVWMDTAAMPGHIVLYIVADPWNPDVFYTIEATGAHDNDTTMLWYRYFSQGFQRFGRYNGLYRPTTDEEPEACPGGELEVIHRESEQVVAKVDPDGSVHFRERHTETIACSECRQQWLVETNHNQ